MGRRRRTGQVRWDAIVWVVSTVFVLVIQLFNVYIGNRLVTDDTQLRQLQEQVTAATNDNTQLEEEILHDGAYTTIHQEALNRGFKDGTSIIYLP